MRQPELTLLIIAIVLTIVLFLAVLPVELRFFYKWGKDEHSLLLRLEFFHKKIGFGIKVLFDSDIYKKRSRFIIPFRISEGEEHHHIKTLEEIANVFQCYQKMLQHIEGFMKRGICRSFNWKTELGFTDYALTGMATGLMWAGKGMILGYLNRSISMDSCHVQVCVEPFYGRRRWESSINCILTTHLGHIIIVFSRFLFWLIMEK